MKTTIALILLFLGLGFSTYGEPILETGTSVSTFSIPPFEEESTVVGIDGWTMVSSTATDQAIVRSHGGEKPGLLLTTYGIEKRLEEPIVGEATVTVVVQFGMVSEQGSNSSLTFMPIVGVGVGSAPFGFSNRDASNADPGGFFYTKKSINDEGEIVHEAVILVSRDDIVEGSKYTLVMDMDLSMRTFVLTVSGTGMDGKPFEVKSEETEMGVQDQRASPKLPLHGIRLAAGLPPSTELFVESITLAPKGY